MNSPFKLLTEREASEKFLQVHNLRELAHLLDIRYRYLVWYASNSEKEDQYTTFEIPKRNGKIRQITAPVSTLKLVQTKLNWILQIVYKPRGSVYGSVKGKSIVGNAQSHQNQRFVLNLDLEDFSHRLTLVG